MMVNDLRPIKIISAPTKVLTLFGQRHFGYERNLKTGKQLCDLRPVQSLALLEVALFRWHLAETSDLACWQTHSLARRACIFALFSP